MKKGVFFDLDGTLIDTLPDICGVLNMVRDDWGLKPLPFPEITAAIGKGAENLIRQTFRELPGENQREVLDNYRKSYQKVVSLGGKTYPGVEETLLRLKKENWLIGVATNKPHSLALSTLEHYLPKISFDVVMGPEKVSQKKPNPQHLLEALVAVKVEPGQAWFIGDDPVDLACAEGAGVRFLGAGWGFGGVNPGPERLMTQFSDILGKILQ